MNVLERALVEKDGREHGWENVVESIEARVLLASVCHRRRATATGARGGGGWQVTFQDGRLVRELARSLPGLAGGRGGFDAPVTDVLAAARRRAAQLSLSLPDQAARTSRERAANALAGVADKGTEVERLVRQRAGQDIVRDALFDRGLIAFDAGGGMGIASVLASDHRALLHLDKGLRLRWVAPEHLPFLQWYREHVSRG